MRLAPVEEIRVDVAVVGAGGAGLRAAYEAAAAGADTLLVTKGRIGVAGATAVGLASTAGFAVPNGAGDPLDSPDVHYDDIMKAAQGCADPELVRILVDEAVSASHDLERWGVDFIQDPANGAPLVAQGDFASRPRNRKIYHHGKPIAMALRREIEKVGVRTLEHAMVLDLLCDEHGVQGLLALTLDGRLIVVRSGAAVLTTGGAGQLFRYSLMPSDITGDGYALGYRGGARLANMEFMQAGFGTIKPALNIIMSWFWGVLPKFLDREGRPVLEGVLPREVTPEEVMTAKVKHYPFSTSDASKWLEVGAKRAMEQGRADDAGGFFMDLREVNDQRLSAKGFQQLWRVSKEWLLKKNMDITKDPLRVGVFGHAINGGLTIDAHGQSTLTGLLAAGENAAGPYGADRLGGNMLLNCQVFGKRAGLHAAEIGRSRALGNGSEVIWQDALATAERRIQGGSIPVRQAHARIKDVMTRHALVVRTERGLDQAERDLVRIREEIEAGVFAAASPKEVFRLNEALNLTDVGQMMVGAARLRKESRGSHFREDAPELDPAWACSIFVENGADGPQFTSGQLGAVEVAG